MPSPVVTVIDCTVSLCETLYEIVFPGGFGLWWMEICFNPLQRCYQVNTIFLLLEPRPEPEAALYGL
jgi:hypothetical protein